MADQKSTTQADRKAGRVGYVVILMICAFAVVTIARGCNGPYNRAMRLLEKDPCAAAKLLAQDVRADWKASMRSLMALAKIDKPCALRMLIELMDLPDSRWIDNNVRRFLWENVQSRTAGSKSARPPYDPSASQDAKRVSELRGLNGMNQHQNSKRPPT
jgi:hypothetical protein